MTYEILSSALSVTINPFGAQLISVKLKGKERLWQNLDGTWEDHAPVMFPHCGRVAINYNHKSYPILLHGFACNSLFSVIDKSEHSITLRLTSSDYTKNYYPFNFIFEVTYVVENQKLNIIHSVKNTDNKPIYFGLGGHESFSLDGSLKDYSIVFSKKEKLVNNYATEDGFLSGEKAKFKPLDTLPLKDEYFKNEDSLVFSSIKSDFVCLKDKSGKIVAKTNFKGCKNLLLWTSSPAYICIEPWSNMPDLISSKNLDISKKATLTKLQKNKTFTLNRSIEYFD